MKQKTYQHIEQYPVQAWLAMLDLHYVPQLCVLVQPKDVHRICLNMKTHDISHPN